jgi:hypothetical protein
MQAWVCRAVEQAARVVLVVTLQAITHMAARTLLTACAVTRASTGLHLRDGSYTRLACCCCE